MSHFLSHSASSMSFSHRIESYKIEISRLCFLNSLQIVNFFFLMISSWVLWLEYLIFLIKFFYTRNRKNNITSHTRVKREFHVVYVSNKYISLFFWTKFVYIFVDAFTLRQKQLSTLPHLNLMKQTELKLNLF